MNKYKLGCLGWSAILAMCGILVFISPAISGNGVVGEISSWLLLGISLFFMFRTTGE